VETAPRINPGDLRYSKDASTHRSQYALSVRYHPGRTSDAAAVHPGGGIGRHSGLKSRRLHGLAGSTPVLGTTSVQLVLKELERVAGRIGRTVLFLPPQFHAADLARNGLGQIAKFDASNKFVGRYAPAQESEN
jgi:hypothetical protein